MSYRAQVKFIINFRFISRWRQYNFEKKNIKKLKMIENEIDIYVFVYIKIVL